MNYKDFELIIQAIKDHNNFLILIHDKPDGDAVGSATAFALFIKKLGKNVTVLSPSSIPGRLHFVMNDDITYANLSNFDEKIKYDYIFSVDVASNELIGGLTDKIKGNIDYAIDHHQINTLKADNLYVDSEASAAGEIIFEIISMYSSVMCEPYFDKDICSALFTSISSDTGCFKYSNTTSKTHVIASYLLNENINSEEINRLLFDTKSYTQIKTEQLAYEKLDLYFGDKLAIVCIDISDLEKIGATEDDTETISQLARMISGVSVGVLMREKAFADGGKGYKFSLRSNYNVDVSELASAFGGGGHKKAAGCTIYEDKAVALEMFLKEAEKHLS